MDSYRPTTNVHFAKTLRNLGRHLGRCYAAGLVPPLVQLASCLAEPVKPRPVHLRKMPGAKSRRKSTSKMQGIDTLPKPFIVPLRQKHLYLLYDSVPLEDFWRNIWEFASYHTPLLWSRFLYLSIQFFLFLHCFRSGPVVPFRRIARRETLLRICTEQLWEHKDHTLRCKHFALPQKHCRPRPESSWSIQELS